MEEMNTVMDGEVEELMTTVMERGGGWDTLEDGRMKDGGEHHTGGGCVTMERRGGSYAETEDGSLGLIPDSSDMDDGDEVMGDEDV